MEALWCLVGAQPRLSGTVQLMFSCMFFRGGLHLSPYFFHILQGKKALPSWQPPLTVLIATQSIKVLSSVKYWSR